MLQRDEQLKRGGWGCRTLRKCGRRERARRDHPPGEEFAGTTKLWSPPRYFQCRVPQIENPRPQLKYAQDQTLQVMRFRNRQQNRMIARLRAALDHHRRTMRIERGFGDHAQQVGLAHVKRTRAGDQVPAGVQNLHGAQVQFLVAAQGGIEVAFLAGERGRVEHDEIKPLLFGVGRLQKIETVGFLPLDVFEFIERLAELPLAEGVGGGVEGEDRLAMRRDRERESARVGEAIQRPAVGVTCCSRTVFPLVEKSAGLLAADQVVAQLDAVFLDDDLVDVVARENSLLLGQSLQRADADVVAFDDRAWRKGAFEDFHDGGLETLHALA